MADEKKPAEKIAEKVEIFESKELEVTKHKVKKELTWDKFYPVGSSIYLPEGKTKEVLISNKFI